jgi:hypothetical protein
VSRAKKICDDCGKIHVTRHGNVACKAHRTGTDRQVPCTKAPIAGAEVCRSHGGALTKTKVAASHKLAMMSAEGEIADLMRECDLPDQHPIDGLLEVVRISGSMMRVLSFKVGELQEEPSVSEVLIEGPGDMIQTKQVTTNDAFWGLDSKEEMVPSIYVNLLRVWTERYERACKTALEAGIEERRIQLAEDTSDVFFRALNNAVATAGLAPDLREALNAALSAELRKNTAIEIDLI